MKTFYVPGQKLDGIAAEAFLSEGGMLVGGKWQSPYESSAVQNFKVGTRLVIGECAYRYGKFAVATSLDLSYPVINGNRIPTDGAEVLTDGNGAIGDENLVVLDLTTRIANYYQGGYLHIYRNPAVAHGLTNHDQHRNILASTVGAGTSITLTLDYPLTCIPAATCDVYPSLWSKMNIPGGVSSGEETFVGFPLCYHAQNAYGWVQTWGPVNGHYNIKFPGEQGPNDRECYFSAAGEIVTLQQGGSFSGVSYQRAGFVIPCTISKYGSVMIFMQIAP